MANGSGQAPGYGPPGSDPYAADRAMADWAKQRGYEMANTGDARPHQAWMPFQYLPRFDRIGRELRIEVGDLKIAIVEAFDTDPIKQAAGEQQSLIVFILAPKVTSRVAVRSKQTAGLADDVTRGLSAIGGFFASGGQQSAPPGAVLGDPTLEARCDVMTPSREEGNAALPMTLRRILVSPGFRGAVEIRRGGIVMSLHEYRAFEPRTLEALIELVKQLAVAATPADQ